MANKTQFINRTLDVMVQMALLEETIAGLSGVYVDRGFAAGTDQIVLSDLTAAGSTLTVAQFSDGISVIADYLSFCRNVAVPAAQRKTKLNITRKDI